MIPARFIIEDEHEDIELSLECDANGNGDLISLVIQKNDGSRLIDSRFEIELDQIRLLHSFLGTLIPIFESRNKSL
jgi:hypothetical protein